MSAVAEALETAAAAAVSDEGYLYVAEVARRARSASDAVASLVASSSSSSARPPTAPPAAASVATIPRVHCSQLSLARFRREHVVPAVPVVITGLGPHLTEDGASGHELGWLKRHGSTKKVAVTRDNAHVNTTLACADTDVMDLGHHLERVLRLDQPNLGPSDSGFGTRDGDGTYLYDASIPLKLPSLMGSIRVPRYFAHDFLQRTMHTHAFTASWPSLFVARGEGQHGARARARARARHVPSRSCSCSDLVLFHKKRVKQAAPARPDRPTDRPPRHVSVSNAPLHDQRMTCTRR